MIRRRLFFACTLLVFLVFLWTTYFLQHRLPTAFPHQRDKTSSLEEQLVFEATRLSGFYKALPEASTLQQNKIYKFVEYSKQINININLETLWNHAQSWASNKQLVNVSDAAIGNVIFAMKYAAITRSDLDVRGTQLKFLLTLEGDQQVIFKPKWYQKDEVIKGSVYAGKDRYGSEILAFYLSIILNMPLAPISVARNISLKHEILPVATARLLEATYRSRTNRTCIYGKCLYCKKEDPICASDDANVTGAVIFNVNKIFNIYRSPWQRTYKKGKKAVWEESNDYCKLVKNKLPHKRLLDLIDTAIFDFLIQNGDRHHYETLNDTVVWLDNGKGLGNPHIHHIDVLAPLYQCCIINQHIWRQLLSLRGGMLKSYLKLIPNLEEIVSELHLNAIEDRLLIVFATVEYCKNKNPNIIKPDYL